MALLAGDVRQITTTPRAFISARTGAPGSLQRLTAYAGGTPLPSVVFRQPHRGPLLRFADTAALWGTKPHRARPSPT